jgi:hypothetical protein
MPKRGANFAGLELLQTTNTFRKKEFRIYIMMELKFLKNW